LNGTEKKRFFARITSWRIGGKAEWLAEVKDKQELKKAVEWGRKRELPITILGGGSNVLISDKGIEGLVILNRKGKNFSQEKKEGKVKVVVESGVNLAWLLKELFAQGTTGLEKFVGIPGTIGGAVFNNIHGKDGYLFAEVVKEVEVLTPEGKVKNVSRRESEFAYDFSRFQKSGEIILAADLVLPQTPLEEAKKVVKDWGKKKILSQPQNSAGCVFKNLSWKQQKRLGLPTASFGYVIDKILGLKGKRIGGARISEKHANFIVNETGKAKAAEVMALIRLVQRETEKKLGFTPQLEIFLLGSFD